MGVRQVEGQMHSKMRDKTAKEWEMRVVKIAQRDGAVWISRNAPMAMPPSSLSVCLTHSSSSKVRKPTLSFGPEGVH